jgi:FtsH-binding integral membrane protein
MKLMTQADIAIAQGQPTADRFMRWLLQVDKAQKRRALVDARSAMSKSILISAVRCMLTYLIIPLAGPTVGIVGSAGRPIGAVLCVAGMYTSTRSMRKFWIANHRMRWVYTVFAAVILTYMVVSLIGDIIYWA